MTEKISIDGDKCIGCGTCVMLCPEIFEMIGNKANVKSRKSSSCAKESADNCQANAITMK
jgi:ferredoxin